ncbi:MAG TPA: hypothetical protein VL201_03225 [Patescibacteria group bacterium]|jgi:hypothetical protein|nr:hypothetical protein [Patescibacteria group bacterium]
MLHRLLIGLLLLNQFFLYSAEDAILELVLAVFVNNQITGKQNAIGTKINNFRTSKELVLIIETEKLRLSNQTDVLPQDIDFEEITKKIYFEENKKAKILHGELVDSLTTNKNIRNIIFVSKRVYHCFSKIFITHQKSIEQYNDNFINKWCPLMQCHCWKQVGYDEYSNYFGGLVMDYLKDFSKILPARDNEQSPEREDNIRDFLNSMVMQELLRPNEQTFLESRYGKNIMQHATLFLTKQVDRAVEHRLYFLIPFTSDLCNRSLLEIICKNNDILLQYECHHNFIAAVKLFQKSVHA